MTINEFINSFAESGFNFTFKARNEEFEVVGKCIRVGEGFEIKKQIKKIKTIEQSRAEIKALFNKQGKNI